jgi:hypothetical protein
VLGVEARVARGLNIVQMPVKQKPILGILVHMLVFMFLIETMEYVVYVGLIPTKLEKRL